MVEWLVIRFHSMKSVVVTERVLPVHLFNELVTIWQQVKTAEPTLTPVMSIVMELLSSCGWHWTQDCLLTAQLHLACAILMTFLYRTTVVTGKKEQ